VLCRDDCLGSVPKSQPFENKFISDPVYSVLEIESHGRILFANSDLSGFSIFEGAQYRGVTAADRALAQLGVAPGTSHERATGSLGLSRKGR
jgi:hypothetical protein